MKLFSRKRSVDHFHSTIDVDIQRIIGKDTPFGVKEAYRALYTNILYLPIEDKCKKFVLTSAYPGEGKTSISINLAYTIAINSPESKILIVDADMRSPRVAQLMSIDSTKLHGLSEYLAGIDAEPNFVSTIHPNLTLLASGAGNANSPGLITSSRMKALIAECESKFDYVIFDTPPVNIVADALLFSDIVNGYILAARADYSDTNAISDALDKLNKAESKVLGIVLCSYNSKKGGRYGGYNKYGKYGKYGKYNKYANTYYNKDNGFNVSSSDDDEE